MKKKFLATVICSMGLLVACGKTEGNEEQGDTNVTSTDTEASVDVQTGTDNTSSSPVEPEEVEEMDLSWLTDLEDGENKGPSWKMLLDALEDGEELFAGDTNEEYKSSELDWLYNAGADDYVVLIYRCDDVTHGNWGVLGWRGNANGGFVQGEDVAAASTEVDKDRFLVYTVADLADMFGLSSASEFETLNLQAWNGGHIVKLTYVPKEKASALEEYFTVLADSSAIHHTYDGTLSNPNASEEAKALYEYIKEVNGTGILAGQQESTWKGSPDYEMDYILENTGRLPAIRGLDFLNNGFGGVTKRAKEWWEQGGIVTIAWHTGKDFNTGYNECKDDNLDWDKALTPGTEEFTALVKGMDRAVPYLQELEDAGVPVLWRPYHEFDGAWFWWGKGGPENFKKLWVIMYDRYTNYWGLDNLIWVLAYSGNGIDMAAWYPGDEYVDICGADSYTDGPNHDLFEKSYGIAAEGMPVPFHECGKIPTVEELTTTDTRWCWFMTWTTEWLMDQNDKADLSAIYNSDYVITLDELPAFK